MDLDKKKTARRSNMLIPLQCLLTALLMILYAAVPLYAWFYRQRTAAAVAEISDPTAIYINAANKEDIRYMDLSGIDVENDGTPTQDGTGKYKDFVFCIRGIDVSAYKLQLAYTTNNQFEYELYHATLAQGDAPADAVGLALYTTHPVGLAGVEQQYYAPAGSTKIVGDFLNRNTGASEILAYDDDTYHDMTYAMLPANDVATVYGYINKYAEPIYWQSRDSITPTGFEAGGSTFCDYYLLRVIWTNDAVNNKETDIIYISARNNSG